MVDEEHIGRRWFFAEEIMHGKKAKRSNSDADDNDDNNEDGNENVGEDVTVDAEFQIEIYTYTDTMNDLQYLLDQYMGPFFFRIPYYSDQQRWEKAAAFQCLLYVFLFLSPTTFPPSLSNRKTRQKVHEGIDIGQMAFDEEFDGQTI